MHRRYGCPDIRVQYVNYVAERTKSCFSRVRGVTLSVPLKRGRMRPDSTDVYEKGNKKITGSDFGKSKKLVESMAF